MEELEDLVAERLDQAELRLQGLARDGEGLKSIKGLKLQQRLEEEVRLLQARLACLDVTAVG